MPNLEITNEEQFRRDQIKAIRALYSGDDAKLKGDKSELATSVKHILSLCKIDKTSEHNHPLEAIFITNIQNGALSESISPEIKLLFVKTLLRLKDHEGNNLLHLAAQTDSGFFYCLKKFVEENNISAFLREVNENGDLPKILPNLEEQEQEQEQKELELMHGEDIENFHKDPDPKTEAAFTTSLLGQGKGHEK